MAEGSKGVGPVLGAEQATTTLLVAVHRWLLPAKRASSGSGTV